MFWAVVVAFIGITSAVISNVYSQIDEFEKLANSEHKSLEVKVTDNSILQAKIETQLANIQKDLVDIKKSLSK
jgi:hypothetical protein